MTIKKTGVLGLLLLTGSFVFMPESYAASPTVCNATLVATKINDLSFGDYEGTAGGTITVDTAGVRTATGGVVLMGGTVSAATYTFSNLSPGCSNRWIYIRNLPVSISIAGPASMTVNNFVTSVTNNRFKLNSTPTVTIGADLLTNAAQTPGSYTGNFSVDFEY